MRGLAFEYRAKRDDTTWRRRLGPRHHRRLAACPPLLWGVAFANILRGVPIDADMEYVGGFFNLLNPYALLGGVTTLLLFLTHGALFIALKTDGPIRHRARALAVRSVAVAAVVAVAFLGWTQVRHRHRGLGASPSSWPPACWSRPGWPRPRGHGRAGPSSARSSRSRSPSPGCSSRSSPTSCRPPWTAASA